MKFKKKTKKEILSLFPDLHEYLSTSCVLFVYYSHIKKEEEKRERE